MAKNSKKPTLVPEPTKVVEVIPKDLKDSWGAIQALQTAVACLNAGAFTHHYSTYVKASVKFLEVMHEDMVEKALKHPQAHMIAELKAELDKEKEDGKTKKAN